jgi:hypothetical protein
MTHRGRVPRRVSLVMILAAVPLLAVRQASAPLRSAAGHVVLVGIDGLSPEGLRRVDAPAFQELSSQPMSWRLGPMLPAGLTLRHYPP